MFTPTLTSRGPVDMKVFERVIDINLMGVLHVLKHATVYLTKNDVSQNTTASGNKRGLIILVSSILAKEGQAGTLAYSASKGALEGMLLPMARDLGRYGVRALAIAPSLIETSMTRGQFSDKLMHRLLS